MADDILLNPDSSDPASGSAHRTPMRWRDQIDRTDLPEPVKSLITQVGKRTRLWKREKGDVAAELIAHFTDALATGVSPDDAIDAFGDPRVAAKLIRRGKVRNRSYLWHASRWFRRGIGLLFVMYIGLCIYFYAGHPVVKVDYAAQMNESALKHDVSERAWPIYQSILDAWTTGSAPSISGGNSRVWPSFIAHDPGDKEWPDYVRWINSQQGEIERLRHAASLPTLGLLLNASSQSISIPIEPTLLLGQQLSLLNDLRQLANILSGDAIVANETSDGGRETADIIAINRLADQLHQDRLPLIGELVSIGIRAAAIYRLDTSLTLHPELLSDSNLKTLADTFGGPRVAADIFSYDGERMMFKDYVQRRYTDNGQGDGRITSEGLHTAWGSVASPISAAEMPFDPLVLLLMASRRDLVGNYDRLFDLCEADLHESLREVDHAPQEALLKEWDKSRIKYMLLSILAPPLNRTQEGAEIVLGQRDGVLCGIAFELFKRHNGQYPALLAELVPTYLPAVPADRITGDPVRYEIKNGKPVVYSVGVDRKDNGGTPPIHNGEPANRLAAEWSPPSPKNNGDWILYPQPD